MDIVHVTSSANPRFKHAYTLRKKRGRRQHAQLLLEGVRLINDCMSAGVKPALLFVQYSSRALRDDMVTQAIAAGTQVLYLDDELFNQLSDTIHSQGVVAVVHRPAVNPGDSGLTLVVDGLRDPGNLGTLLRVAAATAVDQVITLPGVVDPWAPKVLRAGMGAHFRVAIREARSLAEVEDWIGDGQRFLADTDADTAYDQVNWLPASVLLVGGEATGIDQARHLRDVQPISIPMASAVESLNAAVATAVILFEAIRQRRESDR